MSGLVHSSIIHRSNKVETMPNVQQLVNGKKEAQPNNGILFGCEKKLNTDTCYSMNEH